MPRNNQGLYTLPLPPVQPGELIESAWANTSLDDIASALTASLPRDGSAAMVGPLILSNDPITNNRQAIPKEYVDNFLLFGTGMPVGSVVAYAGASAPPGFLLCNGQAVSRTTYAGLFTAIGTTYGIGDGATTFNVPNLSGQFIRGRGLDPIGTKQDSAVGTHTHPLNDPGHDHSTTGNTSHTHTQAAHTHVVGDPGHGHQITEAVGASTTGTLNATMVAALNNIETPTARASAMTAATGITLGTATPTINPATINLKVDTALTKITIAPPTGATETRPSNVQMDYYIKALNDSGQQVSGVTSISSSDPAAIAIDSSTPATPIIQPQTNVAFGLVKLDASTKIPSTLLAVTATEVAFTPEGTIAATNVQDAIAELDSETQTALAGKATLGSALPLMDGIVDAGVSTSASRQDHVHPTDTSRAPLVSPTFSGIPAAPTATAGTNNTQIATTAFVANAVSVAGGLLPSNATPLMNGTASAGIGIEASRDDHVHPTDTSRAPLASPALTGVPTAPTATVGTNTTQIATTAFVLANAGSGGGTPSDANPLMNGTAAPGVSTDYSRGDHVHPTDTSRAALASPTFTGTPAAPTAAAGTNTTQIATTAFVNTQINTSAALRANNLSDLTSAATARGNLGLSTMGQFDTACTDGDFAYATAGNQFSVRQQFNAGITEKYAAVAASNIDCSLASVFSRTVSGATSLTVNNVAAAGNVSSFILELTNGGSATVTWWSGIKWAGGTVPSLTAAGTDILGFYTRDGGVTWRGSMLSKDSK